MPQYVEAGSQEAAELAETLGALDSILEQKDLENTPLAEVALLRKQVRKMLVGFNTDLAALGELEANDRFKTDPTLANQRYRLIEKMEEAKVDFEFDVLPQMVKLTQGAIDQARAEPPAEVDEDAIKAAGEEIGKDADDAPWTFERVVETAEGFLGNVKKVVGVVAKTKAVAGAISVLLGLV